MSAADGVYCLCGSRRHQDGHSKPFAGPGRLRRSMRAATRDMHIMPAARSFIGNDRRRRRAIDPGRAACSLRDGCRCCQQHRMTRCPPRLPKTTVFSPAALSDAQCRQLLRPTLRLLHLRLRHLRLRHLLLLHRLLPTLLLPTLRPRHLRLLHRRLPHCRPRYHPLPCLLRPWRDLHLPRSDPYRLAEADSVQ